MQPNECCDTATANMRCTCRMPKPKTILAAKVRLQEMVEPLC